jgi:hypothetical protein
LVLKLTKLLDNYALRKKIIAYVKDEGSNLNTMTTTLKSIVNYDVLGLEESFQSTYFGHAFSNACQYATTRKKFAKTYDMCQSNLLKEI